MEPRDIGTEATCVETHISVDFEEEELPEDLMSDSQHL